MKPSVLIPFLLLFFASCRREEIDTIIVADFAYEVVGNDYAIPVKIAFGNKSIGAQTDTAVLGQELNRGRNLRVIVC